MNEPPPPTRGATPRPTPLGDVARAEVLSPRAFWIAFGAGWFGYWLLTILTIGLEGGAPASAGVAALVVVGPLVLPAAVLARRRHRLLRPMPTLFRFAAHKAAVGLAYAASVVALGGASQWLTRLEMLREMWSNPRAAAAGWFLVSLFLYTILLVFLLWLDALERMQATRELAAEEAVLRARAEAKALRAQFNPHFVFNTLHSLMLLVRKEPDAAERAIEDVAALIRYASTLQRREVDQVTLGKELAFARRYLALEKLRLADRLTVAWDVDATLAEVLVPAFSLQTLLENAIKHGISPKPEGGTIRVRAALVDGSLSMSVEDDGVGADRGSVEGEGGSGLQLLRSRLANVHGGRAELAWETAPGAGFRVHLDVPARRADVGSDLRDPLSAERPASLEAPVPEGPTPGEAPTHTPPPEAPRPSPVAGPPWTGSSA